MYFEKLNKSLSSFRAWKALLSFLLVFTFVTSYASAETFTIRITANSAPVAGVNIYGNQGVKDLSGRFTDSQGKWVVDTTNLISSSFSITYAHSSRALRFEPAELSPSLTTCPGRICEVKAFEDGVAASVIEWSVRNSQAAPMAGIPVNIPGSNIPCPKLTDNDGYVFFSVQKKATACNDSDSNADNNFYKVTHHPVRGKSCTFTNSLQNKFSVCAQSASTAGFSVATCSNVQDIAVGNVVNYEIQVLQESGLIVAGTSFFGLPSLENLSTDSTGKIKFSTTQAGIPANSSFSLIPYGMNYQYQPAQLNISPNSCPNNVCKITAFRNGSPQGIIKWKVVEGGVPAAAVNISPTDSYICPYSQPAVTNQAGYAYFPSIVKAGCDITDSNRFNDLMSFNATQSGCTFTHTSQTPFQLCSNQHLVEAEMNMYCGAQAPQQHSISGKIFDRDGLPLPGAKIFNNGTQVANSDSNGRYSIIVDSATSPKLSSTFQDYVFDPASVSLDKIARDFSDMNFNAVAPDPFFGLPPPGSTCPAKDEYRISGFVIDENGLPLSGATIYNNYEEMAVTDTLGYYSFNSMPGDGLWVTAEYYTDDYPDGVFFDPAAIAFPDNYCDQTEVNFQATNTMSHVLFGRTTDSTGQYPLAGIEVTLTFGDTTRTTVTDENGEYMHTVPDGEEYELIAQGGSHNFTPVSYHEVSDRSYFTLNFRSHISLAPTPTPTNTATVTNTPTITFTPTATATVTRTFTASNTATATRTATNTATFTNTFTPSKTATATKTFTASATATATKTATNTLTPSATATATTTFTPSITFTASATATASKTATSTRTATNTATFTNTHTFTATHTATITHTATKTATTTNTASPTATFTNTATATKTPNLKPYLTSVCSEAPNAELRWKVTNQNGYPVTVTWDIYGSNQSGELYLPPLSSEFFNTATISNNTNTARIFVDGQQVDVKSASFALCPVATATSTPTQEPTMTKTPNPTATPKLNDGKKVTICHYPPGNPENFHTLSVSENAVDAHMAHGDYLGECTDITPAPIPSVTPPSTQPTATATPNTSVVISGAIKGKNGRNLSSSERKRMAGINITVIVKQLDGAKQTIKHTVDSSFEYNIPVKQGQYQVSMESEGRLTITSQPKRYRLWVLKSQPLHFAVRAKNNALLSAKSTK